MTDRTGQNGAGLVVEGYVRSSGVSDAIDDIVDGLGSLESEGVIDELTIEYWPRAVSLTNEHGSDAVEVFERVEEWARRRGVSVRPAFEVRTVTSAYAEGGKRVLRTPAACLVASVDDRIAAVFPHTHDGTHYTVADGIAALRNGSLVATRRLRASPTEACPECEADLINVQGVAACRDCDWTDRPNLESDPSGLVERNPAWMDADESVAVRPVDRAAGSGR